MVAPMNNQKALSLHKAIQAYAYEYRENPFTLSSGRKSRHYFNMKAVLLEPASGQDAIHCVAEVAGKVADRHGRFNAVAGMTTGADILVYGLAARDKKCATWPVIVRKEEKAHGKGGILVMSPNAYVGRALVVEDVSTTGESALRAVRAMRKAGFTVEHVITVLDREEGAMEAMDKEGVALFPLFKKSDFAIEAGE